MVEAVAQLARASELGHQSPLPQPIPWMERILSLDAKQVLFAHDSSILTP